MKANFDHISMDKAIAILGINRNKHELNNMIKALYMCEWLNTESDLMRRVAAIYVVNRWNAYQKECAKRREKAFA
jgi:hypothetical protein